MMDLAGSILSLVYMQIDSTMAGQGFLLFDERLNLGKFLLVIICTFFDSAILVQYYWLYPEASALKDQSLLMNASLTENLIKKKNNHANRTHEYD